VPVDRKILLSLLVKFLDSLGVRAGADAYDLVHEVKTAEIGEIIDISEEKAELLSLMVDSDHLPWTGFALGDLVLFLGNQSEVG